MAAATERTDELVREYLLFRGFTAALKQLDAEIKADREKGFRVDKIVDQLQQFVQSYDLAALRDYWSYLDRRLFSRLEDVYRPTVNKLKTSLFRYYLVHAIQNGRNDKAQEFFLKLASELQNQAEWKDWFVLPFLPAPDSNPTFATYFSRQWADTFIVSLHNFLSVLFQCMPVPVILNFEAECLRSSLIQEENESLRHKLFALQAESSRMKKEELEVEQTVTHHKLPAYVANMDRLGDSELDMTCNQRSTAHSLQSRGGFLSSFLSQSKKGPSRPTHSSGASPTQTGNMLLGKKEPTNHQSAKGKEGTVSCKDGKIPFSGLVAGESSSLQQRQKRLQEHGKERKELLSKGTFQDFFLQGQSAEKKTDTSIAEAEPCSDLHAEQTETSAKVPGSSAEAVGVRQEQPFIVLSQEEYGEHHSSIMYCRVDCSGRRVASLDVDGVIKVWSFNPIMQTKASSISKSPLLSLEWATKRDRLLLLGSGVGTVRLYDTEAKKNLCEISIDEDMPRILSLACSPSGASFVCSAAAQSPISHIDFSVINSGGKSVNQVPGKLLLWDTKTMKQQLQFSLEPEPIAINCTAFNHNGNLLVTGAADGIVRLFDMQQHECAMSWKAHDGEVYSVEFSYDENTVYSIGEDGKFIQWNIHKIGLKVSEYDLPREATGPFILSGYSGYKQVQFPRGRLFAFDSEGNYMLTCSSTGGVIFKLNGEEKVLESCLSLGGHRAPVVTVDWSTAMDCGTCLTASMDGKIKLTTLLAQKS
ncbi:WD repeat-containing protein 91 isoform X1 [Corvus cornix cornix]|uniref:WD repeat-containing protein 91 isoform X1 n=2 Tax=Corvus TaxID=30420 RepID=UPI0013646BAB|nr:WD repeat-containing protein 91 isoform X1 [Corvus moneduloides]XP_039427213.1 WD repeat-containing protein 91 isoform X1 [Corvus cornix cornix]XP_048157750.1 WD repeat-containing protein 91 isoform X1 [Corvus hawaiiensis]